MDPITVAALIAAGSNMAQGGFNFAAARSSQAQSNSDNKWTLAQRQAEFNKNTEMAYEFAKNGISWRIEDAAKHGISPLAALGSSTPQYSPVIGVGQPNPSDAGGPMRALGSAFADTGNNVSRAMLATKTKAEKLAEGLDLARRAKENDLLDLQIKNAQLKLSGQGAPGIPLSYQQFRNVDGSISVVPSEDAARASGGQMFGPMIWQLENGLIPAGKALWNAVSPGQDYRGWRTLDVDMDSQLQRDWRR